MQVFSFDRSFDKIGPSTSRRRSRDHTYVIGLATVGSDRSNVSPTRSLFKRNHSPSSFFMRYLLHLATSSIHLWFLLFLGREVLCIADDDSEHTCWKQHAPDNWEGGFQWLVCVSVFGFQVLPAQLNKTNAHEKRSLPQWSMRSNIHICASMTRFLGKAVTHLRECYLS